MDGEKGRGSSPDAYLGEILDVFSKLVTVSTSPLTSDVVANADIFGAGTVSGSYTATQTDNGVSQSIRERESGGKKQNRYTPLSGREFSEVPLTRGI